MKALKGYLEHAHQAHPMAAFFVLGTHRDVADKRAVDPPDKLVKVKYVFVSCACRVIHSYIIKRSQSVTHLCSSHKGRLETKERDRFCGSCH